MSEMIFQNFLLIIALGSLFKNTKCFGESVGWIFYLRVSRGKAFIYEDSLGIGY